MFGNSTTTHRYFVRAIGKSRKPTRRELNELYEYTCYSTCEVGCLKGDDLTACRGYHKVWTAMVVAMVFDPRPRGFRAKDNGGLLGSGAASRGLSMAMAKANSHPAG